MNTGINLAENYSAYNNALEEKRAMTESVNYVTKQCVIYFT